MAALLLLGAPESFPKPLVLRVSDWGLWNPWIRRALLNPFDLQVMEHPSKPVMELSCPDVPGLPPSLEESTPYRCDQFLRIVPPHCMPCHVGHALLEVLHVCAGFQACDVTAHENPTQLRPGRCGAPLGVPGDVEWVVLFSVVECRAKTPFHDAASDPEIHHIQRVTGGLLVGHAILLLWGWVGATYEEVVDETAHETLRLGGLNMCLLHLVTGQVGQLRCVWDAHWESPDLSPHFPAVHCVRCAETQAEQLFNILG